MKKITGCLLSLLLISMNLHAQSPFSAEAHRWADSVFNTLTDDQRIAQLMVIRQSSFSKNGPIYLDSIVTKDIQDYNIGAICLFQGSPAQQAIYLNTYQKLAKTPVMVCIDGEWGLGMRFDSVLPLNRQMMLGAANDTLLTYEYGELVAAQCRRMGIHVNYAPVVDINNNPANPVINDRSFGEDKERVARLGIAYMKGMQDNQILASAKHFPGHGDVAVDSHHDLPVIRKSLAELDSLEFYPFKKMIDAGVGSVMIAHLSIPAIDSSNNVATSLSKKAVTGLLRDKMGFDGLTFTDALEMQGVAKFFKPGEISAKSLIAGNDMLCLPASTSESIRAIRESIELGELSWDDIYAKCKKVLLYKHKWVLPNMNEVDANNLTEDLNAGVNDMRRRVAEKAITVLSKKNEELFSLRPAAGHSIAYLSVGSTEENHIAREFREQLNADVFLFDYEEDARRIPSTARLLSQYDKVVIGVHNYSRFPANQFGISKYALELIKQVQQQTKTAIVTFGNPYALRLFCDAENLVSCYENDSVTQQTAVRLLMGEIKSYGTLPVSVCDQYPVGSGLVASELIPYTTPETVGVDAQKLQAVDSIVLAGIEEGAFPGCVVLAMKDGKIFYEKAFGTYNYGGERMISVESIFDMASVTKICATTIAIMKLYDEGKVKLNATLGAYLPWVRRSDKKNLKINDILLHQAGLVAYIPFYRKTIDANGNPLPAYFRSTPNDVFSIRVADNMYMRADYIDTLHKTILDSKLGKANDYIYSDNDFIFLGRIVEEITGMSLDQYVQKTFYGPMGLKDIGFQPRFYWDTTRIVPTESEKHFRQQHLLGDVHDPGAAMFGGIAGHAGLFSTAKDIAAVMQMLLNGGEFNGHRYLKKQTVDLFTDYSSQISRRALGFDKPQKDNLTTTEPRPYPSRLASPLTFGHTGYTGTCTWADPRNQFVYVFLSNRVNPSGGENLKLIHMNIRGAIQDAFYQSIQP